MKPEATVTTLVAYQLSRIDTTSSGNCGILTYMPSPNTVHGMFPGYFITLEEAQQHQLMAKISDNEHYEIFKLEFPIRS